MPIGALANRQHGLVAHWQLTALGLSESAIQRRLTAGRLFRIHRGVYAAGHCVLTPRGYWMAAVLSGGPTAVLSHHTALALHDLRRSRAKIDVIVPGRARADRSGIRIHRGELVPQDITIVDGIQVTTVARSLLDASPELDADQLTRAIEDADRRESFDLRAVEAVLERRPRARGRRRLIQVLAAYRDPAPTRSELERLFLKLLGRAGIPMPLVNTIVAGLEVDFYWPGARLVVELDGRAYHSSPRAFETDRIRDARLLRAGIRVLRITYQRLISEPDAVIDDLRALTTAAA